ncbi:MAG: hypothetical protein IT383_18945 [Deltaproteobacteria bacterium]|nr:hypothetical protein [Deltaproteobacteria bacterium]
MQRFFAKLTVFLTPFLVGFGFPAFVLVASRESLSADEIARLHFDGPLDALYGAAYTNPDARYKLVGIELRKPDLVTIGSSRVLEFESGLFVDGSRRFYNGGLLIERLYEIRRAMRHFDGRHPKYVLLGIDQWSFNAAWPSAVDNPLYEREISAGVSDLLNAIQRTARFAWPDLIHGKLSMASLIGGAPHLGVNARTRGNGFRWDGSMVYADRLRDPNGERDFDFRESFSRIAEGRRRFEFGSDVDEAALKELELLLREARERGLEVVAYLPPFAPSVERRLRATGKHSYVDKISPVITPIFARHGFKVFDFTSCESVGCTDEEFLDGFHAGTKADARMLAAMADQVPWLDGMVDQELLTQRIERTPPGPGLSP